MKILHIILSIVSLLLVGSTLLCGFWIHTSKEVTDMASSLNFHKMLGIVTAISVLLTTILAFLRK